MSRAEKMVYRANNRKIWRAFVESGNVLVRSVVMMQFFFAMPLMVFAGAVTDRESMQLEYVDKQKADRKVFAAAPIYHVIPERNLVTLSAVGQHTDTTIYPDYQTSPGQEHTLNLSGWGVSSLASFSAKNFGIGFAAELGEKAVVYNRDETNIINYQESTAKYSGLGAYAYYIPTLNALPRYMTTTLIMGYKKLDILHKYSGNIWTEDPTVALSDFRYTVHSVDYGANIGILLAKRFTVFPWLNYQRRILGTPEADSNASAIRLDQESEQQNFTDDQILMWDSTPRFTYGIDFAVTVGHFDIHLGGLFGVIARFSSGSEKIEQNDITASISYSIKSH